MAGRSVGNRRDISSEMTDICGVVSGKALNIHGVDGVPPPAGVHTRHFQPNIHYPAFSPPNF